MLIGSIALAGAAQPPSDKGDDVVTGGDLAFMNDAAPGGLAEVQLGRMAMERAASPAVKKFAEQIIEDHSMAGKKLEALAKLKNVELPPGILPEAKQTSAKLSKLNGEDFDREYVRTMLEVHERDVTGFQAVARNATDADVKEFATATLPTLQHHLEMIRALAQSMSQPAK